MFLRFIFFVILVYNTSLRYENVNKNIPCLFVSVSVTLFKSLSRVCKLRTKYKLCALRIGYYRNVRGLGKSIVVFRLFEKLRYSNERSTIF